MTHYIVTEGSYSDYHICFVSSDKKVAEDYCHLFNCDKVEVWPDEVHLPRAFRYEATIASDGEIEVRVIHGAVREDRQHDLTKDIPEKDDNYKLTGRTWLRALGETEEQAKKIAIDAMARLNAKRAGIA